MAIWWAFVNVPGRSLRQACCGAGAAAGAPTGAVIVVLTCLIGAMPHREVTGVLLRMGT